LTAVHPAEIPSVQPSSSTLSGIVRQIECRFVHFRSAAYLGAAGAELASHSPPARQAEPQPKNLAWPPRSSLTHWSQSATRAIPGARHSSESRELRRSHRAQARGTHCLGQPGRMARSCGLSAPSSCRGRLRRWGRRAFRSAPVMTIFSCNSGLRRPRVQGSLLGLDINLSSTKQLRGASRDSF
jgi:hypothetical protein